MIKVLITGANGQLGQALQVTQPASAEVIALSRQQLDIAQPEQVNAAVAAYKPHWIINAAAYNAVDAAENDQAQAFAINKQGPGYLAKAALAHHCRLIHVSTDYVFDGTQGYPYTPEDACHPLSVYGNSKWQGEQEVVAILPQQSLIIRTSWVYSVYARNFVKSILQLLQQRESLRMVMDQIGSPTWANTLAKAIWSAVQQPHLTGVYHWSEAGVASKYDFAVAIQDEAFALKKLTQKIPIQPITSKEFPTPAARPLYSVLNCSKSWQAFGLTPLHWREALQQMLKDLYA